MGDQMKFASFLSSLLASAALVACGGGGSSTPSTAIPSGDVADKYIGTWAVCVPDLVMQPAASKFIFTFTKTSATSVSFLLKQETHNNSSCAGAAPSTNTTGTFKFAGTKAVGADVADKIDVVTTIPAGGGKDLGFVSGNTMKLGDESSDANGYPNALDTVNVFVKQ
jgi:hypothetical protein